MNIIERNAPPYRFPEEIKSDKDEKLPSVPAAPEEDPLLASLDEGRAIEEMVAQAAGIKRAHPEVLLFFSDKKKFFSKLAVAARELIRIDPTLEALLFFLSRQNEAINAHQGEALAPDSFYAQFLMSNDALVSDLLQGVQCDFDKLPQEIRQALMQPEVANSIGELHFSKSARIDHLPQQFPKLKKLQAGEYPNGLEHVSQWAHLEVLHVDKLSDCQGVHFSNCSALTTFICNWTAEEEGYFGKKESFGSFLERLGKCQTLHTIQIDEMHGQELHSPALKGVRHFSCTRRGCIPSFIARAFPELQELTTADEEWLAALPTMTSLRSLTITLKARALPQLVEFFQRNNKLSRFSCQMECFYGATAEAALHSHLEAFSCLKELTHLQLNELDLERGYAACHFHKLAANHPKLQEVTLKMCYNYSSKWLEILAPLSALQKVRIIQRSGYALTQEAERALRQVLPRCTVEQEVDLLEAGSSDVNMGKEAKAAFVEFVQHSQEKVNEWTQQHAWDNFSGLPSFLREALHEAGRTGKNPIKVLNLTRGTNCTSVGTLQVITEYFPRLESLSILESYADQKLIDMLAQRFPLLQALKVKSSAGSGSVFKQASLTGFRNCTQLTEIRFLGDIKESGLRELAEARPNLRLLQLGDGYMQTDWLDPVAQLQSLESLDLSSWWICGERDHFWKKIGASFQALRALQLPKEALSAEQIRYFKECKKLQEFGCMVTDREAIREIAAQHPQLTALKLRKGSFDKEDVALLAQLPELRKLSLPGATCLDAILAACPRLEELDMINYQKQWLVKELALLEAHPTLKRVSGVQLREPYEREDKAQSTVPEFLARMKKKGCVIQQAQWGVSQ